jgi:hypothetical protein
VVGHRTSWVDGDKVYSARLAFLAAGGSVEVMDQMLNRDPTPVVGTFIELHYPEGRPDLARISRPKTWAGVYILLIGLLIVLVLKLMGYFA